MKNIILASIRFSIFTFPFSLFTFHAFAQPLPAVNQSGSILIINGTIHVGNGTVIENGVLGFDKGKITLIGSAKDGIGNSNFAKKIDAQGAQIYPGLVAANTTIGLVEIEAVRSTNDTREVGEFNPSVRSIISYNAESQITPTVRSNGVLTAQIVPEGGTISGRSSVVELDGWNWEEIGIAYDNGLHVNFPSANTATLGEDESFSIKKNENYGKQIAALESFFKEAQSYSTTSPSIKNLKFEAMRGVFNGNASVFVSANAYKEIRDAVTTLSKYTSKLVIVGGTDSYLLTDLLKEKNVAVVLGRTQELPSKDDDDYDQPYKTPSQLEKAGVLYCITELGAWKQRNLAFEAGQGVAYGLTKEQALSAITRNAAKIIGVDSKVGTLEVGKNATFIISKGDILDMRTSQVQQAFISGKEIDLNNKQKQLHERYKVKYDRAKK